MACFSQMFRHGRYHFDQRRSASGRVCHVWGQISHGPPRPTCGDCSDVCAFGLEGSKLRDRRGVWKHRRQFAILTSCGSLAKSQRIRVWMGKVVMALKRSRRDRFLLFPLQPNSNTAPVRNDLDRAGTATAV